MDRPGQRLCIRMKNKLEDMSRKPRPSKLHTAQVQPKHLFSTLGLLHLMGYRLKEVEPEPEKASRGQWPRPRRESAAWSIFAELTNVLFWPHPRPTRKGQDNRI